MQIRLPPPGSDELAHSQRLRALIADTIRAEGPMPFGRYMQACLYTPGLGYYSAGATKFGAAGDFVTAPELGDLFAGCAAESIAPCLRDLGSSAEIFELGAGSGALAADVLPALAGLGCVPQRYRILEPSADLRQRQQQLLHSRLQPDLYRRVEWLDGPPGQSWQGVLLANEVIDALPVERFVIAADQVLQEYVTVDQDGQLQRCEQPADEALRSAVRKLEADLGAAFVDGYRSELCLQLPAWLHSVSQHLQRGLAVWSDYGYPQREYYLPERDDGTLMAYFRHRAHTDPFHLPGLDDLTASVDFSALAAAACADGWSVAGYTSQAQWLLGCGLQQRFEAAYLACADTRQQLALAQQVRKLTMPEQMGERFQAMLLSRGDPAGEWSQAWADIDLRDRL